MIDRYLIPVCVLLAAMVVSRVVSERALALLSAEQKGRLLEVTSPIRKYGLIVVVVILLLTLQRPVLLGVTLLLYFVGTHALVVLHARRLALPAAYMKTHAASAGISLAGIAVYYVLLLSGR